MKPTVYLETTIASYLTARMSKNLVTAAHQQLTHQWWAERRSAFDLYVSQLVIDEAGSGNVEMAARRLAVLNGISLLAASEEARALAEELVRKGPVPPKAATDAAHIALATVHGIEYLLTWNCRHIANAEMRIGIEGVCRSRGLEPPILCTPEELMGGHDV